MPNKLYERFVGWLDRVATTELEDGSNLKRIARDGYEYSEGDHSLIVQVEVQSGKPDVIIYSSTIDKWLPPYEDEPLSQSKHEEILQKVIKHLQRGGITYEVQ